MLHMQLLQVWWPMKQHPSQMDPLRLLSRLTPLFWRSWCMAAFMLPGHGVRCGTHVVTKINQV